MILILGLGNPGDAYHANRHNAGFYMVDRCAAHQGLKFTRKRLYWLAQNKELLLAKPNTYMNRSGLALQSLMMNYKVDRFMVLVDDVYLPLGEIRIRQEGSPGGHNGLKSIAAVLGHTEFDRLRIGVNAPGNLDLAEYVLSDFGSEEVKILNLAGDFVIELISCYTNADFNQMLDVYSKNKESYSEQIRKLRIEKTRGGINEQV
ncbi:MAG: aminoacyl-tRNA hydrolase [Candidatus Cloacimonetes bacterium]|nr:aminoacyl-tRNA hydrolase [Candidatus Cloacimonadota bacterium]